MKNILYIVFSAALLLSCEPDNVADQVEDLVVIKSILFEGEDEHEVLLSRINPIGDQSSEKPISGASVSLVGAGQTAVFTEDEVDAGHYLTSGELTTFSGQVFRVEAVVDGRIVSSETSMPEPVQFISISDQLVLIDEQDPGAQVFEVSWIQEEGYEYVLLLHEPDDDPESIQFGVPSGNFEAVYELPTEKNFLTIYASDFRYYGEHLLEIIRIDTEYASVFRYAPGINHHVFNGPDNVSGGAGYVTGVSSVMIGLNVQEQ
ncbi:MAG: DUF4249 family protein [Flavobacteriales bacterium]|nr:DUF4249 family protein [Flavobacteriales bacterium]